MTMPDRQTNGMRREKFFGKYRGRVVDNLDPLGRGRLRVQVPQVLGTVEVWATPCVPYAGKNVGIFALPPTDTGVWVEFEAGDPSFPIWTGCFWGSGDIDRLDALPHIKFWKTEKFTLRVDDTIGEIVIENAAGSSITISAIEVSSKSAFVRAEATGGKKTELGPVSFSVNNGAFEVL
jgi:hypothetical protein